MNNTNKKCLILGAGIAGIATAIRMACKGYEVEVLEANQYAGGKLSCIELQGYRFDAGPSLFTMPQYVEELFKIAGKKTEDYFEYEKLDITCKYFYEDGTILNAYADIEKFKQEIKEKTNENPQKIDQFLQKSKTKYDITAPVFLEKSLHQLKNYLSFPTLKGILNFNKVEVFKNMHQSNEEFFEDDRLVQFFDRYATYNGSNPYETPATMNVIPHLEFGFGAFFPKKGMHSITTSLVKLAEDLGVKFHFRAKVKEILLGKKWALGASYIQNDVEKSILAQKIISNIDIAQTYRKFLPKKFTPEKLLNQPKSSSALIFYWGMNAQFPELEMHNIFFSKDYKKEFQHIWQEKNIYQDPTIYINITAKNKTDDAPNGGENWFVMVNVPNNEGQNWDEIIPQTRQHIQEKLTRLLKKEVKNHIVCETILDPRTIETRTGSTQGALYGNSSNNRFSAFMRHANFSSQIPNLYFCGGSVHPGGGIPLCLLSAKIVGEVVGK